ncbi:hypothetical protein U1Q18_022042 [Sarracenia purpurea var. burkii]
MDCRFLGLGGVCFDLSDVPIRDPPDSPLTPQWFRLEGGSGDGGGSHFGNVFSDIQLSVRIKTQADDAFPESSSSDAPHVTYTRSKVYQSLKLWYLRVMVIEAQNIHIAPTLAPLTVPEVQMKSATRVSIRKNTTMSHEQSCLVIFLERRFGLRPWRAPGRRGGADGADVERMRRRRGGGAAGRVRENRRERIEAEVKTDLWG